MAETIVAMKAEQPTYPSRQMIMIDMFRGPLSADCAQTGLLKFQPLELHFIDAVTQLKKEVSFAPISQTLVA